MGLGVLEGGPNDPLDPFEGAHVLLEGDLVRRALLQMPPGADVHAFGVLPEDDQVHVFRPFVAQRTEPCVEEADGTEVHVEIEFEAQAQQDLPAVAHVGDARIAEGTEQDGIEVGAEGLERLVGEGRAILQIALGPEVEGLPGQGEPFPLGHGGEDLQALVHHLRTDAVPGYDCELRQGGVRLGRGPRRVNTRTAGVDGVDTSEPKPAAPGRFGRLPAQHPRCNGRGRGFTSLASPDMTRRDSP